MKATGTADRMWRWSRLLVLVLALAAAIVVKRMPGPPLRVVSGSDLRTHYLVDYDYHVDPATGEATMGHLVVLNPGDVDAKLTVTVYFEERTPESFDLLAPARASTESNYTHWPVRTGERFALEIDSSVPVFCQATIGWNNTSNEYSVDATPGSPHRAREAAKSYLSIRALADRWYVPDGYIIDKLGRSWVRESEWAILLNPHDEDVQVVLTLYSHGETEDERIDLLARRVRWLDMSKHAPSNRHYGARFVSPLPIAAQWLRTVHWADSTELMTYWSVPMIPLGTHTDGDEVKRSIR